MSVRILTEMRILMVGLDGAGKTTILNMLESGNVVPTQPSTGTSSETIEYKNINFIICDVAGSLETRPKWKDFYETENCQGIIFVVDSSDSDRIAGDNASGDSAQAELQRILTEDEFQNAVLLVLANKQDLSNALSAEDITGRLKLNTIDNRKWHIQETCAMSNEGLNEGLDWLASTQRSYTF
jgi:ADP-ribosylation factor protein 1